MKNITHTPAPWEDNGNGLIYGQCSGDDDEAPFVADVCTNPNVYTEQERTNARLIAAAPELLEILRAVAELRRMWRSEDEAETIDSIQFMDGLDVLEVDAAIAKATAA